MKTKNFFFKKHTWLRYLLAGVFIFSSFLSGYSQSSYGFVVRPGDNFTELSERIKEKLREGYMNISVQFVNGDYFYTDENKIDLSVFNQYPGAKITFGKSLLIGNDGPVNIISGGNTYTFSSYSLIDRNFPDHKFLTYTGEYTGNEIFVGYESGSTELKHYKITDSGNLSPNGIMQAKDSVEVLNEDRFTRFLIHSEDFNVLASSLDGDYSTSRVYFTSCYQGKVSERLDYLMGGNIYFKHHENTGASELNGDWSSTTGNGKNPENAIYTCYYVTNVPAALQPDEVMVRNGRIYIPKNVATLYECRYQNFINITESNVEVTVSGLNFIGSALAKCHDWNPYDGDYYNIENGERVYYTNQRRVINLHNIAKGTVINNTFKFMGNKYVVGITGDTTYITWEHNQNSSFNNNTASDLYGALFVSWGSENLQVLNNTLNNSGMFFKDDTGINVNGNNFLIKGNVFKNFAYSAIRTGGDNCNRDRNDIPQISTVTGVIEENMMYHDAAYKSKYLRNTMMDGGVISVWTHNTDLVIRDNIIHDIAGKLGINGIYCDGGAYNVNMYGNLIYNLQDGYTITFYHIHQDCRPNSDGTFDLYLSDTTNVFNKTIAQPTTTNVHAFNNVLIGKYQFQGNGENYKDEKGKPLKDENGEPIYKYRSEEWECHHGNNFVIYEPHYGPSNGQSQYCTNRGDVVDTRAVVKPYYIRYINQEIAQFIDKPTLYYYQPHDFNSLSDFLKDHMIFYQQPIILWPKPNSLSSDIMNNNFLYPNPTTGLLNIRMDEDAEHYSIRIYDSFRQMVYSNNKITAGQTIDISNHQKGVYIAEITVNGVTANQKIILK